MCILTGYAYTGAGKQRTHNEDALLISNELLFDLTLEKPKEIILNDFTGILSVFDGIGGHSKGEVAARIVGETLKGQIPLEENDLKKLLLLARQNLEEYVKQNPENSGLGCAVAGLTINNNEALVFNIGDCRVYRKNGRFLEKLTHDHSIVEELTNRGVIAEADINIHPLKNTLTSAVVGDGYNSNMEIYTKNLHIFKNDVFLICSDGLWGEFLIDELEEIFSSDSLELVNSKLLASLLTKPLKDNVSYLLIKLDEI